MQASDLCLEEARDKVRQVIEHGKEAHDTGDRVGMERGVMTSTLLRQADETMAKALVRQYFDNGFEVYDARRKPLGTMLDVDRTGDGFVVKVAQAEVCLFIPMRLVAKVKRGRVYLCEMARYLRRKSE